MQRLHSAVYLFLCTSSKIVLSYPQHLLNHHLSDRRQLEETRNKDSSLSRRIGVIYTPLWHTNGFSNRYTQTS